MANFISILDKIGGDAKKVFAFFQSPTGQIVVKDTETAVFLGAGIAGGPMLAASVGGIMSLVNNWATEIFKTQALATSAGAAKGFSDIKAYVTISAVTPLAQAIFAENGWPQPTAEQLKAANDALVLFFNSLAAEGIPMALPATPQPVQQAQPVSFATLTAQPPA